MRSSLIHLHCHNRTSENEQSREWYIKRKDKLNSTLSAIELPKTSAMLERRRLLLLLVCALTLRHAELKDVSPASPSFLFLLGDDIGWADFGYNNGTALTPHITAWAHQVGSVRLEDFHSGGTVCSPTRATVLTGRHHFRDCVDGVYGCSDMSSCVPDFQFAPSNNSRWRHSSCGQ
jgi:hypothetical protein